MREPDRPAGRLGRVHGDAHAVGRDPLRPHRDPQGRGAVPGGDGRRLGSARPGVDARADPRRRTRDDHGADRFAVRARVVGTAGARRPRGPSTDEDVSNDAFPYLTARYLNVGEVGPVWAQRISYAGELGWELYGQFAMGDRAWDLLWEAGREHGIAAVGAGAFDSLRVEKGYRLWGQDIHTEHDPFEAGLGFAVRMDKGDFQGRACAGGDPRPGLRPQARVHDVRRPDARRDGQGADLVRRPRRELRDVGELRVLGGSRDRLRLPPGRTSRPRERRWRSSTSANDIAATVAADPLWDPKGERQKA